MIINAVNKWPTNEPLSLLATRDFITTSTCFPIEGFFVLVRIYGETITGWSEIISRRVGGWVFTWNYNIDKHVTHVIVLAYAW